MRRLLDLHYDHAAPEQSARVLARAAVVLPPRFVQPLREALAAADLDLVLGLLADLSQEAPTAAAELRILAERFDWEALAAQLPPPTPIPAP